MAELPFACPRNSQTLYGHFPAQDQLWEEEWEHTYFCLVPSPLSVTHP